MNIFRTLGILAITLHALAAPAADSPPQDVVPGCPAGSEMIAATKSCKAGGPAICSAFGGTWNAGAKSCTKEGTPTCPGAEGGISYNSKTNTCQFAKTAATSSAGAFVGDTLQFVVDDKPAGTVAGAKYCVISQTTDTPQSIDLVKRDDKQHALPDFVTMFGCTPMAKPTAADSAQVPIASLEGTTYYRDGWTYGALLVPFKYHIRDKEFSPAGQVGPYVGRSYRLGSFGLKFIGTLAYGPITTNNGSNTTTDSGSATVKTINGLSYGLGVIGTITKGPSPFQFGIVFGRDKVSASDRASYPYTGRSWVGAQLGYDFTTGN